MEGQAPPTPQGPGVGRDGNGRLADRQIDAGAKWHPAIEDAMADAVAAVLLISADFLSSGFCSGSRRGNARIASRVAND